MITVHGATADQQAMVDAFNARHASELSKHSISLTLSRSNALTRETYQLSASLNGSDVTANLAVTDSSALRYGLNHLRRWLSSDESVSCDVMARPDFRYRGVIEGFYGTPWTPAPTRASTPTSIA